MQLQSRLHHLQQGMSRTHADEAPVSALDLSTWIGEVDVARDEVAKAATAFRTFADINDALRLLNTLLDSAHASHIDADQARSLLDLVRSRMDATLEHIRAPFL